MDSYEPARGDKVITLVSGGLDAACVVAWGAAAGLDQRAIYFNYGHDGFDRELACARMSTHRFNVPLEVIDLSGFRQTMLGRYGFPINMGRNLLGGLITSLAFGTLCAGVGVVDGRFTMLAGIHGTDLENRPPLRKHAAFLEEAVNYFVGCFSDEEFHLHLPFAKTDRAGVIRSGFENGVHFEDTWSCQANTERPCGACYSCEERSAAFATLGKADPQVTA